MYFSTELLNESVSKRKKRIVESGGGVSLVNYFPVRIRFLLIAL
jgi:hypothetical protein